MLKNGNRAINSPINITKALTKKDFESLTKPYDRKTKPKEIFKKETKESNKF